MTKNMFGFRRVGEIPGKLMPLERTSGFESSLLSFSESQSLQRTEGCSVTAVFARSIITVHGRHSDTWCCTIWTCDSRRRLDVCTVIVRYFAVLSLKSSCNCVLTFVIACCCVITSLGGVITYANATIII